jgi:hypothetical protein
VRIDFGNRCDRTIPSLDLRQLRVTGACAEGAESELRPFDPRNEIRAASLPPHGRGSERIAFGGGCPEVPHALCVDLARIAPGTAHAGSSFVDMGSAASQDRVCFEDPILAPSEARP